MNLEQDRLCTNIS